MKHAIATLGLLGAAVLAALAIVTGASAHADYESSTPGAGEVLASSPASVTVNFDGEMQKVPGTHELTVADGAGMSVTAGAPAVSADGRSMTVALQPALAHGTYTVHWANTGAEDGHERSGSFTFSIGETTMPAPAVPGGGMDMPAGHTHGDDMDADHEQEAGHEAMEEGATTTGLVMAHLAEQNGSGVDGRVEILPVDGGMKSQVGVYVNGIEPGSTHMSHVHEQSVCGGAPGKHAGDLHDLTSDGVPYGSSVTVLDVPFDELVDGTHAVLVHAGPTGGDKAVLACAVIPDQPRVATPITLPSAGTAGAAAPGGGTLALLGLVALSLGGVFAGAGTLAWNRAR